MMQKAANALNAYMARNSTPDNKMHWARLKAGYVLYSGVTQTHDEEGRILITPVHLDSRVIAKNAPEVLLWVAMQPGRQPEPVVPRHRMK